MQGKPVAITLLAILFWIAGAINVVGALQEFGHFPELAAGAGTLFLDNQLDGWVLAGLAIISLFLSGGLWAGHSWASRAVIVVAVVNLLATLLTRFEGGGSWLNVIPGLVVNAAILLYAQTADARAALRS
ncbi:MAG: hypothetical protein QM692_18375 [Thermomicrobiales bacterium]